MYSLDSKVKEISKSPIGKDIFDLMFYIADINPLVFKNPLVANMSLKSLPSLTKGFISADFLKTFVKLLNQEPHMHECGLESGNKKWWKSAVFYQIYPRSFKDSNGDGIGDLLGIVEKLDYLKHLGINGLWLSPVYDSPNDDNGYDIRDYEKIMEEFGSMEDFDLLLEEAHKRDMKIIMDLVINHTSDEHIWFQDALKNKESKYKDYYIFKKGKDGSYPNNWTSAFKGPAWNYYEELDEYALHVFSAKQMDLNWENEDMRKDIYKMINFWLDKGVDGFRLDVINLISKPQDFPDGEEGLGDLLGAIGYEHIFYGPRLKEFLSEMNKETFSKYDAFTIGEGAGIGLELGKIITCESCERLSQIFNFDLLNNPGKNKFDAYSYDLRKLKDQILKWQENFQGGCRPAIVFENHDNPRFYSKVSKDPKHRDKLAKLINTIMLTIKATPYFYQGQEIGMTDVNFTDPDQLRDVESINIFNQHLEKGDTPEEALKKVAVGSRDNARIPMQWEDSAFGGFSDVKPWIMASRDYMDYNVKNQLEDPNSILNFTKDLIALRKEDETLVYGDFLNVDKDKDILSYYRLGEKSSYYIEINLLSTNKKRNIEVNIEKSGKKRKISLLREYNKKIGRFTFKKIMSNYSGNSEILRPYECNIYLIEEK